MRIRTMALASGALISTLLLSGCMGGMDMGGMDMGGGSTETETETTTANAADQMFAMMMIPHHEQAIEMSDLVLAKEGVDPRVTALAEQIKAAQGPEIETLKGWLSDWGMPYDDSMGSGMEGMTGGMMTAEDMAALEAADGATASRLYLEQMIVHHQGAIEMAQAEVDGGQDPDVIALAQQIIDDQTAEISQIEEILASL